MRRLKAGGFVIDGNPFSTYCLVAPLSIRDGVMRFKDVFAFILFYSNKHIQAGLPIGSVLGDTLRRFLISLARFPKVKKAIFVKAEKVKEDSEYILRCIKETFEKGNVDETTKRRGRFDEYTPGIIELAKSRAIEFKKLNSIDDLEKMYKSIIDDIYNDFELPDRKDLDYLPETFKPIKATIEAYSPPTKEDLYTIKKFESVSESYDYCTKVVKYFGKLYPNGNGILRYEVKVPYITIALEKWNDLDEFLKEVGIQKEVRGPEKGESIFGRFSKRLRSENIDRLNEFITSLIRVVESKQLSFSRDLDLVSEKDTPDGAVQIGWSKIKVSLDEEDETIVLTFHNILRSVDIHNGLPYNLYYCIKMSEYVANKIKEECEKSVRVRAIFISLGNLHAYYDNIRRE